MLPWYQYTNTPTGNARSDRASYGDTDGSPFAFVFLRFGLLTTAVGGIVSTALIVFPITFDFSRWYAGRGLFTLAIIVAIALHGFRIALGKRPVFGLVALED